MTLVEIALAIAVLVVALLAIGGVMVTVSHGRESISARRQVLRRLESLIEEVKGTAPDAVEAGYANTTHTLGTSILGLTSSASPILVKVDATDPLLLAVDCTATYSIRGVAESMTLSTQIYNP
jgi:type II secretory pathway pseudopilin PulG